MDFFQDVRQTEVTKQNQYVQKIFDVLCDNEGEEYFQGPVVSDRIVEIVNSASRRRLGKLDTFMVLEYLCSKNVPPVSVLTALLFIEKLVVADPYSPLLTEVTAIDLFAVSMVVASKYLHDDDTDNGMYNAEWADEFDMDLKELNELEVKFISALNWEFFVTTPQILCFGIEIGVFHKIAQCGSYNDKPEFDAYTVWSHVSQILSKYSKRHTSSQFRRVSKFYTVLLLDSLCLGPRLFKFEPTSSMLFGDKISGSKSDKAFSSSNI
ncbi:Protein CNPPD1 isoform 4 [Schistosoma japonicum]|uniref:Protein CNPPD1 n=1 Tax=Schistosoma japonicum TaxID=6182 RepID=A0A4Z2DAX5_SCHJA|nr:Protein CNPPD1 isoform 4 [Schistosoma japonicum]